MSEAPKPEEKPAPEVQPQPQTPAKIDLTELAKKSILDYVGTGKIVLEQKIDQKLVNEIAKALKCSPATIYNARNKLLEERSKAATPAGEVKVEVTPQPKPPIPTIPPVTPGQPTVKLVPLSDKINLEKIFKNFAGIIEGFGFEVPGEEDLKNLGELWKPTLDGVKVKVTERIVDGDTVLGIAVAATVAAFGAPIAAQFLLRKGKKKEETPETKK